MSSIVYADSSHTPLTECHLVVRCRPYLLDLRHQWTTSHSSTSQRTNALFSVEVVGASDGVEVVGYGEVGMPPKNPAAGYYAAYPDVAQFATDATSRLDRGISVPAGGKWGAAHLLVTVLSVLEHITCRGAYVDAQEGAECAERFGKSGLQMALLDALGQVWGLPVWCIADAWTTMEASSLELRALDANFVQRMEGIARDTVHANALPTSNHAGYLTVSMSTPHEMAVNALEALVATPFIKVKLDGDAALSMRRLTTMAAAVLDAAGKPFSTHYAEGPSADRIEGYKSVLQGGGFTEDMVSFVVDANAAWSVGGSLLFIDLLGADATLEGQFLRRALRLIEQPFPTTLPHSCAAAIVSHPDGGWVESDPDLVQWAGVKDKFAAAGMRIFADESATVLEDLPALCPFVHGVNIKLEKCGGILAAYRICRAVAGQASTASSYTGTLSPPPSLADLGRLEFTWIGTMVCSRLGCNGAAQLLPLTGQGDVDGSLLVTEGCQVHKGGFVWPDIASANTTQPYGRIGLPAAEVGLGCALK